MRAADRLDLDGLPYQGVQADLNQLPFMAGSFDGAVDIVSWAHNTRTCMWRIAQEVARVLKPGGHFFSVIPTNKCSRRTFCGLITSFLEREEVMELLHYNFTKIMILRSTYQLDPDTTIDTWVTTCQRSK